ncbi:MAG TPA: DinB family protein [Eudoraea sp.]|nr:DinB family protein [Eudoraea sp.]
MTDTIKRLEHLIRSGLDYIAESSETELALKPTPEKWSKKEILGHLVDSGINNLQRFTEIQFESKPYKIRNYNQDELVRVNDYQHSETREIVDFWVAVNQRIKSLMEQQSEKTLNFKIELDHGNISDLRFLMKDYVDHMEHHLNQIMKSTSPE